MDSRDAHEILLRYRPGTADERAPEVRAALEQATGDPRLARWLEEHLTVQSSVQLQLRRLTPPPGLKEQILSERPNPVHFPRMSRRIFLAAGLAVLLLMAVSLAMWWSPHHPEDRFATFRSRVVRTALRGYAMQFESADASAIRHFLTTRNTHLDWEEPPGLAGQPLLGCAVLTWQGRPAAMICYGAAGQPNLWLFVVEAATLPDPPSDPDPEVVQVNRLTTISWSRDGKTYVLAGSLEPDRLRRLVIPTA